MVEIVCNPIVVLAEQKKEGEENNPNRRSSILERRSVINERY